MPSGSVREYNATGFREFGILKTSNWSVRKLNDEDPSGSHRIGNYGGNG